MYPVIFRFSIFIIPSYSVMLALAFALGALLLTRRAASAGIDPRCISRLPVYIFVAAIFGARIGWGLLHYDMFPQNLVDVLHRGVPRIDGLVMNGGLAAALLTIGVYARVHQISLKILLDAIAPCFALGVILTRLGCFLSGCCFGHATDLPWGVIFPAATPGGQYQRSINSETVAIHPTQLYNALAGVAILAALLWFERRFRVVSGSLACLTLALYALSRFLIEFLRPDGDIAAWFGLNHNHYSSLIFLAVGAGGMVRLWISPASLALKPAAIQVEGAPTCHYS